MNPPAKWPSRPRHRDGRPPRRADQATNSTTSRGPERGPKPNDARHVAADVLLRLERGEDIHLSDAIDWHAGMDPRERALARELALGAVRYDRLYDHLADRFLRGDRQPVRLRVVLRLIAHQLFALDRIPVHAAVGSGVELIRDLGQSRQAGLVNAIARRLADLRCDQRSAPGPLGRLVPDAVPSDPAVRAAIPSALAADLFDGGLPAEAELTDCTRPVPLCTRTRPGAAIADHPAIMRRDGEWTWWRDPQVALQGAVSAGEAVVQDRSQGELIDILGPTHGLRVVDLCAAPGGKSLALADAGCQVIAADANRVRTARIPASLTRVVADGQQPALAAGWADVVVVDAPCSNSGVLARRPEAKRRYLPENLASLQALQRRLLRAAATLVKPAGQIVYATCSLVPSENQEIAAGLAGWAVTAERTTWPDGWQAGGYVAVLRRTN